MRTILDVGGGTGAFSIPLARRGFSVTHLDLSPAMLDIARQKAHDVESICFVEANATDLSQFADCSFDLVLNLDGAISFCGSDAEQAIRESCRVARHRLILTVSHKALMVSVWCSAEVQASIQSTEALRAIWERGEWHQDQFPGNPMFSKGCTQDYFGAFRTFLPNELRTILDGAGMRVLRCGGLGSLALLCGQEVVQRVLEDPARFEYFVGLCERFDHEIMPYGPGTRQRAGLIAVAAPESAQGQP